MTLTDKSRAELEALIAEAQAALAAKEAEPEPDALALEEAELWLQKHDPRDGYRTLAAWIPRALARYIMLTRPLAPAEPVDFDVEALARQIADENPVYRREDMEGYAHRIAKAAVCRTLAHRGARWPGADVLRGMARECAALGYERIGEKRNAQQVRFGEFDDGILPQLALEAVQFAIYYMKHGDAPPTCPQSPEKDA